MQQVQNRFLRLSAFVGLAALGALTACNGEAPETQHQLQPALDVVQTMNWVLEPAADAIWENSGWEITIEGERELFPQTDEDWDHLVFGAATIVETGTMLMLPGRKGLPEDMEAWNAYAQGLIETGNQLIEASAKHDKQAVFDLGGQLYNVCVACHQNYGRER